MKKILYIIPILVIAMVGLTQDAKAQTGQTGNASDGGVQAATGAAINGALNNTGGGNNNQGGGNTVTNGGTVQAQPTPVQSTIKFTTIVGEVPDPQIEIKLKQIYATALGISVSRIMITFIVNSSAG